jgi:two-component system LytT family response regulator
MRALIVEDEAPARAKLHRWLAEARDVEVVGAVEDGPSAQRAIAELAPHIVFLDIQIPVMSGLALAEQLRERKSPLIVFVTAHDEHAVTAFDTNAVDYLLKPYDKDRLARTLDRVRARLAQRSDAPDRLQVPVGDQTRFIDTAAVIWLEADDNYVRVHTANCDYFLRRTLRDLLDELGDRFVRIHKSHAVNVAAVEASKPLTGGDCEITLRGGTRLRVSRRYRANFLSRTGR